MPDSSCSSFPSLHFPAPLLLFPVISFQINYLCSSPGPGSVILTASPLHQTHTPVKSFTPHLSFPICFSTAWGLVWPQWGGGEDSRQGGMGKEEGVSRAHQSLRSSDTWHSQAWKIIPKAENNLASTPKSGQDSGPSFWVTFLHFLLWV